MVDATSDSEGVALKKLKNELRISKKAEQLAKEKLTAIKKQLEKTQQDFAKCKSESEVQVDGLKVEVSLLQSQMKQSMQIKAGHEEKGDDGEMLRVLEQYSKQADQKAKEIESIQAKLLKKKLKIQDLKKTNSEVEMRNQKLQAKLAEMAKFSKMFIKNMSMQQKTLKEQVLADQANANAEFNLIKTSIIASLKESLTTIQGASNLVQDAASQQLDKLNAEIVALEQQNSHLITDLDGRATLSTKLLDELQTIQVQLVNEQDDKQALEIELQAQIADLQQSELELSNKVEKYVRQLNENQMISERKTQAALDQQNVLQKLLREANNQVISLKEQNMILSSQIDAMSIRRPLGVSETISLTITRPKVEPSAESGKMDRSERYSRCSSESVRSNQMLHLPEEKNNSDEAEIGDVIVKQVSPKREFPADLAPRPINPGPRPQQPIRQPRPIQPMRPQKSTLEEQTPVSNQPSQEKIRPVASIPKTNIKVAMDPFATKAPVENTEQATTQQPTQRASQVVEEPIKLEQQLKQIPSQNEEKPDTQEPTKESQPQPRESISIQKPQLEETKASLKPKTTEPTAQQQEEGRFSSMINSLLSYLGRKKRTQAFLGQSASKMRFDEAKGRYVFEGESSSEEEVLPEPPKAKKTEDREEKKEEVKELTGTAALTQVAFGGALTNRGRGRGARGGRPIQTERLVSSISPTVIQESSPKRLPEEEPEIKPEVKAVEQDQSINETFVTTLDKTNLDQTLINKTVNMTMYTANDQSRISYNEHSRVEELQQQIFDMENVWKNKVATLQDKIKHLSKQIGLSQADLQNEKQQTQQTMEGMETFIAELKVEGEIFQSENQALRQKLADQTDMLALCEFKLTQISDQFAMQGCEVKELTQECTWLNQELAQKEMEAEMLKITHQMDLLKALQETQSPREFMDLQHTVENLQWQKSIADLELTRLSSENDLLHCRNVQLLGEIEMLSQIKDKEELKVDSITVSKESAKANERERESLKDLVTKLQHEKERLQEQLKDREKEKEIHLRKLDIDRKEMQRNFQRTLQEKESQWQEKIERFEAEKQDQLRRLEDELKQQTAELQKQEVKRSQDNKRSEKQIKSQLMSLEGILNKKEEDLTSLQGYNQEVTQELAAMSQMREKLQEHIIYLQNEIRKRDELLEDGSELVDVDLDSDSFMGEDDSMRHCLSNFNIEDDLNMVSQCSQKTSPKPKKRTLGQVLKNQLEESRNQLKAQVEQKLRAEVRYRAAESKVDKLNEGLHDIMSIIRQNNQRIEGERQSDDRSSEQLSESGEQVVHQIIAKLFKIIRNFDSQKLELQHQLDKTRLQLDDTEGIKFDLEIALDEKQILESEVNQLKLEMASLRKRSDSDTYKEIAQKQLSAVHAQYQQKLLEAQRQAQLDQQQLKDNYQQICDDQDAQLREARHQFNDHINRHEQVQTSLQEAQLELEMAQGRIQQLQTQFVEMQRQKQEAERQLDNKLAEMHQWEEEKSRQEMHVQKAHNDVLRELTQIKQRTLQEKKDLTDQIKQLEEELSEKDRSAATMQQELDQIVKQFIDKKEAYKNQVAKLKAELTNVAEQLETMDEQCTQKQAQIEELTQTLQNAKTQQANIHAQRILELEARLDQQNEEWAFKLSDAEAVHQADIEGLMQKAEKLEEKLKKNKEQAKSALQEVFGKISQLTEENDWHQTRNGELLLANQVLSERVKVLEQEQEKQAQMLTQSQVDDIVEKTQKEAFEAIDKLKTKQKEKEAKFKQAMQEMATDNQTLQEQLDSLRQQSEADRTDYEQKIANLSQAIPTGDLFDPSKHMSMEQHETEMQQLQQNAQDAITAQGKKRDAKEAKLKEALTQMADDLEASQQRVAELEQLSEQATGQQEVISQLKAELSELRCKQDHFSVEQFDPQRHITMEQHESEMQELQQNAKDALTALGKKRDKKEQKLKDVLNQMALEQQQLQVSLDEAQTAKDQLVAQLRDLNDSQKTQPDIQAFDTQLQETLRQNSQLQELVQKLNKEMTSTSELLIKSEQVVTKLTEERRELELDNQRLINELNEAKVECDKQKLMNQEMEQQKNEQIESVSQSAQEAIQKVKTKQQEKEAKFKQAIQEMAAENQTLKEQLDSLRQQSEADRADYEQKIANLSQAIPTGDLFDPSKHMSMEQHEAEMQQLQLNAQDAITAQGKKRDAKEAKLKEALTQMADDLEASQQRVAELEQLSEQATGQQEVISQLKAKLSEQAQNFQETEAQYQAESQNLAEAFTKKQNSYKTKISQLQDSLKQLFDEHETLKSSVEVERQQFRKQIADHIASNATLTQSLDLTRVQLNDDTSKFEAERRLVEDHCQQELKSQENQLRQVLVKIGVDLTQMEGVDSFDKLVEKCSIVLQNYLEDRRQLGIMLEERQDKSRLIEDLEYKLERLQAEKEFMQRQMDESQVQKLKMQVTQMEEERSEMRNDFYIKFNSYSEEVSQLKSKLSKYEPQSPTKVNTSQPKLDELDSKSQNVSASSGGYKGFLASLFLTDSEMARRV